MKNSSENPKTEFLRLSFTLFLIAGIMAFFVALVNNITAPVISAENNRKTTAALTAVLPEGDSFVPVNYTVPTTEDVDVIGIFRAVNGTGYCVKVAPKGYGGAIETVVGFDNNGAVVGVEIISMTETSGIGTKISNADFIQNFIGRTTVVKGDKKISDKDTVQYISGATKSSKAFIKGINAAIEIVSHISGGEYVG